MGDLTAAVIAPEALDELCNALRERGFRVLGPTVGDGAIVYRDLDSAAQLPIGWGDEQDGGTYWLVRRPDAARFGYAVGPDSWKRFLFPPRVRLWRAHRDDAAPPTFEEEPVDDPPLALVGVRACELRAIAIQDRVFTGGRYVDRDYAARREGAFVVAVNCFEPAGTCFCVSTGTGPRVEAGFDLALTEVLAGEHRFVVEVGSERGGDVLAELTSRPATGADLAAAREATDAAADRMGRTLEVGDLRELLGRKAEHPRWADVADRCLSCGNCTLVCPTCFCTGIEDTSDLSGDAAERWRVWDSCFSVQYSYIHGGAVRPSVRSRYRQWLTHKLATWQDQFGMLGCVGCGRCITWCPAAIDLTEEVAALRAVEVRDDAVA